MTCPAPLHRAALLCAAAALVQAAPAAAAARDLGGGEELGVSLARIVAALVVCLIVAVLAILLLRQRSGRTDLSQLFARIAPRARGIQVIETRRLSPHADICVVRHGGREFLLLLMAGASSILSESAVAGEPDEAEAQCD